VPYADAEGNLYFKHAATITENIQSIQAVRKNKGLVMATVSAIIPKSPADISVPAEDVDYIVVNPYNEQVASVLQRNYWPLFTPEGDADRKEVIQRLKFINNMLKITPVRSALDQIMGRLAASILVREVPKGGMVNIGIGFPEEVARLLVEHGLEDDYLFTTEAGSYGGLPTPGIFFGAAINPEHLEPSSVMFKRYQTDLDVAVLGFLQVDGDGNVNVSKRGPKITDYVGPGGFMDIVSGARTVLFIGKWMHDAEFQVQDNEVHLVRPGAPKFVEEVDEITFNGMEGIKAGKHVYYITNVGLFQLMPEGLTLRAVFPGIDVGKDILMQSKARIVVPPAGLIEVIDGGIVSGKGFRLEQEEMMEEIG
jgi:propionate CoA-transferase